MVKDLMACHHLSALLLFDDIYMIPHGKSYKFWQRLTFLPLHTVLIKTLYQENLQKLFLFRFLLISGSHMIYFAV